MTDRNKNVGLIHKAGANAVFVSDGDEYRDWLENSTREALGVGFRSCNQMTDPQLRGLVFYCRRKGLLTKQYPGGTGPNKPTPKQWDAIEKLAKKRGWIGLKDKRLRGFVKRTCKVDDLSFMQPTDASKVISGLQNWNKNGAAF